MHPASHRQSPTGRSNPVILPARPWSPGTPAGSLRLVPVFAESLAFTFRRWRADQGPFRPCSREILATLTAIAHGMDDQGHLVTRLQSSGPPTNSRQVLRARHL